MENEILYSRTPEHDKRISEILQISSTHPDITEAYAYVGGVLNTATIIGCEYVWHGWSMREAFLAGISYAESLMPRNEHEKRRVMDILSAMLQRLQAEMKIPTEWSEELWLLIGGTCEPRSPRNVSQKRWTIGPDTEPTPSDVDGK